MLTPHTPKAGGTGSIPSQGTKIPHAMGDNQGEKLQFKNWQTAQTDIFPKKRYKCPASR